MRCIQTKGGQEQVSDVNIVDMEVLEHNAFFVPQPFMLSTCASPAAS